MALLLWWSCAALAWSAEPPPVLLANVHHLGDDIALDDYWVSEKFDGVRAWWDGRQLLTRAGNRIEAPAWFTAGWPGTGLDGELWTQRGDFQRLSGIVRKEVPDDAEWREVRYMVFDLPTHGGSFDQRLLALRQQVQQMNRPWVVAVEQIKLPNADALHRRLDAVVAQGGEGLMLHRGGSLYRGERSDDLLKLKPFDDAEARVVEHLPGKGKYEGMMGAVLVERADGLRFKIGSGFSDEQRRHPPPVGSTITYAYTGTTAAGVPRFARFLRIRTDLP